MVTYLKINTISFKTWKAKCVSMNLTITARSIHTGGPLTQVTLLYATCSWITANQVEFTLDENKKQSSHSVLFLTTRNYKRSFGTIFQTPHKCYFLKTNTEIP